MAPEDIDALKSPKGGWTKQALAKLGVPWPPPKGWRKRLIGREGGYDLGATRYGMWTTASGSVIPVSHMSEEHLEAASEKLRAWVERGAPPDIQAKLAMLAAEQERRLERRWAQHEVDERGEDEFFSDKGAF